MDWALPQNSRDTDPAVYSRLGCSSASGLVGPEPAAGARMAAPHLEHLRHWLASNLPTSIGAWH